MKILISRGECFNKSWRVTFEKCYYMFNKKYDFYEEEEDEFFQDIESIMMVNRHCDMLEIYL